MAAPEREGARRRAIGMAMSTSASENQPTAPPGAPTSIRKQRVGDWLVELNLISKRQLDEAVDMQQKLGERLGEILVKLNYLSERELSDVLMLQETLSSHASLTDYPIDTNVLRMLNEAFVKKNLVIPLVLVGKRLVAALTNKNNIELLDHVSLLTGYKIIPLSFRKEDIETAITYFYDNRQVQNQDKLDKAIQATAGGYEIEKEEDTGKELVDLEDAPIIELVNTIMFSAIEGGVSDIHMEATETSLVVRLRTDGVMMQSMNIPKTIATSVIARIKVMSSMNITETRRPQDGRFSLKRGRQKYDFRVASIASHWGENVVIRILRPLNMSGGLEKLGLETFNLKNFQAMLNASNGIILVTGPTGSGKSSTLYTCLGLMDKDTDSIVTIEDPVEFPLPGIVQIQVQPKIGLTFATALRTILRLDPDTIMLGEIRDHETLEAAIAAAMTGHLVLATLHTNDAVSTIARMKDMGAESFQISSSVVGVIAQRLIRRICEHCAEEYVATPEELEFLKLTMHEDLMLRRGKGCPKCRDTGYKGRIAIFEILRITRQLKDMINRDEPEANIMRSARGNGFLSLFDDGRAKVLAKTTTAKELFRVIGDSEN